ncbi:GntR family transcriptional regulator [Massilia sp. GCM10023247]|uniref:GntR family transcriptional regulator n=1 Tax=Massilia sp. GCM10023247 TaxID=3252643 RepID=UPI00360B0228
MSRPRPPLKIVPSAFDMPAAFEADAAGADAAGAAGSANLPATGATQRIVDSITNAIADRRLIPGTKLSEQKIGDIFKVSRTVVRQAFNQLSRDRLVVLEPARGAFVATPTAEEARDVFEVRRILETAVTRQLCAVITDAQVRELRAHLELERAAVANAAVPGRTRLLGDFHVVLAEMLGNQVLVQMLGELMTRSSLIALMRQSTQSAEESLDEHVAIVDAFERRDARAAVRLVAKHLANVQQNLDLGPQRIDLAEVLDH